MAEILFLVHRLPYPPNKGDKGRSYQLLRLMAERHRVHLVAFLDDPEDEPHVDTVRQWCASVFTVPLNRSRARFGSLVGLLTGEPLTIPFYRSQVVTQQVNELLAQRPIEAAVVFSGCMAQFVTSVDPQRVLVDFVDVDSAKWAELAHRQQWPLSWLYRREGRRMLAFERQVAARASFSYFTTDKETELFRSLAPECGDRVGTMLCGVDMDYFSPALALPSPYEEGEIALAFTGVMDYWPNVDAVCWFASEVLPKLRARHPTLRFYVVGRNPTPQVRALAGEAVVVTGTVPDVRPYLRHAAAVVAPLRLARGVQTKVLEAMAMGQAIVAARHCAQAIGVTTGLELLDADSADDYRGAVDRILLEPGLASQLGAAARARAERSFGWRANLQPLCDRVDAISERSPARLGAPLVV